MINTKNFILNKSLKYIESRTNYSEIKLKEIRYGLEAIYLTITKFTFIIIVSALIGILKEMLIFSIIFNILRMTSFGLHATKSWICLVASTLLFIAIPYICVHVNISIYIKVIAFIVGTILMFKNSPADTKKKPIVSQKRRNTYKFLSVVITLAYGFVCITINSNFLSNCLMFGMILQNFMISPTVYKIFKLPYNNYITFLKEHPEYSK